MSGKSRIVSTRPRRGRPPSPGSSDGIRRPRRGGRRPGRHRKPRREFLRRRRRASFLYRHRRSPGRGALQGREHGRQHGRASLAAPRGLWLGSGAFDDLVNLPASRLSALSSSPPPTPGADPRGAVRAVGRDARRHRSPNAGWPEAAMAGAPGLRLAGPRVYGGVPSRIIGWGMDGRKPARRISAARSRLSGGVRRAGGSRRRAGRGHVAPDPLTRWRGGRHRTGAPCRVVDVLVGGVRQVLRAE